MTAYLFMLPGGFPLYEGTGGREDHQHIQWSILRSGVNTKYAHYVVSKGAVIGLTRALANEMGEF
jgi:NAD(P)-dependent dehydrogenase (short-subunit alcohol dehydrogenase family)